MVDRKLLDELAAEQLARPPAPPPRSRPAPAAWAVRRDESAAVKRARLEQLDRDMNPDLFRPKPSDALAWALSLGGRICDLPAEYLDRIARYVPPAEQVRQANRIVNRGDRDA